MLFYGAATYLIWINLEALPDVYYFVLGKGT